MAANNKLSLSVQYPDPRLKVELPRTLIRRWAQAALMAPAELAVRFVDAEEGRTLNREYRGKDYATNVLTFAYSEDEPNMEAEDGITQADIVLCTDVMQREAQEQRIPLTAHAAHLLVHGVLHAQGYDHENPEEAEEMERMETDILAGLGFPDPYAVR